MDSHPTNIKIKLQTTIEDHGQVETNTTNATGLLYKKNNLDVIAYDEQTEDNSTIKNLLTIQPEKVSVKRTGAIQMHQQFRLNQTSENVFQHPHGNIHMETFTKDIHYDRKRLSIRYSVRLNGQDPRTHRLTLSIEEENK